MKFIIEQFDEVRDNTPLFEEMKVSFKNLVIENLASGLNLGRLDCIYVPNDFYEGIVNFQIKHNIDERGYTQNEMRTAFGKVISYFDNGKEKDSIFLHKVIFINIFFGQGISQDLAINTVHHELCHVHDHSNLDLMEKFKEEYTSQTEDNLTFVLSKHSRIIWDEYIAPKMSARTKNKEQAFNQQSILDLINMTKDKMDEYIDVFLNEPNHYKIFGEVQYYSSQLLKELSTLKGNLDGIYSKNSDKEKLFDEIFKTTYIGDIWLELKDILTNMSNEYPHWEGIEILDPLNKLVLKTWNILDVYVEQRKDQIYLNVYSLF